VEIQINSQPCKGINLTTRHTWDRREPQVATVHDNYQRVKPGPPYPSVIFHTYASADTPWVARTLSHCTPVKYMVGCRPTQRPSKLLSLETPYITYAPVHNQVLVHLDPTDASLNRHRWGLPPWSFEFMIQTTLNLPIQYSSFSSNCPARSHIKPFYQLIKFSTFQHEPGYKKH
jgi:hypothetical protein